VATSTGRLTAAIVVSVVALTNPGRADCTSHVSTCMDADTLWPRAGDGAFLLVAPPTTVSTGAAAMSLVTTYLARPVIFNVPSADPSGAEFEAVGSAWDATLLGALGIAPGFEADLAVPLTLYRTGVGVSPLSEQETRPLRRAAMRDVRLGVAVDFVGLLERGPTDDDEEEQGEDADQVAYRAAGRLEVALPTGDDGSFDGDQSIVVVPAISGELRAGRFFAGAELGARLRAVSELAGSRIGPQAVISVGAGASVIPGDALDVALEAIALPTTVAQEQVAYVAATGQRQRVGTAPALVPAECLFSARTAGLLPGWSARAGVGTSLRLFGAADLTAPSFRFVFSLTYTLGDTP
jgi:hypothetical protein